MVRVGLLIVVFMLCFERDTIANLWRHNELHDHCDIIELNHIRDQNGTEFLDQFIFWRWDEPLQEYHVRAWTVADETKQPECNYHNHSWSVRFWDVAEQKTRLVTANNFRESLTTEDPERKNRKILDERFRVALIKRKLITQEVE
jgi:hypothetical protein